MKPTTKRTGFTLIELLIVVVILGLLAVISLYQVGRTSQRANIAAMQSDLKALVLKQEIYHNLNMRYADVSELVDFNTSEGVIIETPWQTANGYVAIATHTGLATSSCAVFVGPAPAGAADPADEPGHVTCEYTD